MKPLERRGLDWIDRAALQVVAERRIDAGPDAVWRVIADHRSWPEWFEALDSVEPGDTAEGVGGTRRVSVGPLTIQEEFLAWDPGERFAFVVTAMNRRVFRSLVEEVRLHGDDERTTVRYTQAIDPVGGALVGKLLRSRLRRGLDDGLAGLAARVERAGDRG